MKNIIRALVLLLLSLPLAGCHEQKEYADDPYGNFDALWEIIDSHYCFFAEKDIDWKATREKYRDLLRINMNDRELFEVMSEMLAELKDGHVNLSSKFNTSYYRNWWSDYPQDFDLRTLQQFYLKFDWNTTSGIIYKILDDDIGYMYYPSFSSYVGDNNLDYIMAYFNKCKVLIIDIRDNGGGLLTNIDKFVGRLISDEITGAYICHKLSPAHGDFSERYPIKYKPADSRRISWAKPVILLTNRSCFSAANAFAAVMKQLPAVKIIGARTGGGGGLPFTSELPNGWSIRFSACPVFDSCGNSIESGIEPSEGLEAHCTPEGLAQGKDGILDFALEYISRNYP